MQCVVTTDRTLAERYQLLLVEPMHVADHAYYLGYRDQMLYLFCKKTQFNPITIDFLSGKLRYRSHQGGGAGQAIARAVGVKKQIRPLVLDLTAGLGQDAWILASLGCDVTMIERSPVMAALLEDALSRFRLHHSWALKLVYSDSIAYLQKLIDKPEVIYLDPMYPDTTNSALSKKEMQVLRDIVGHDDDAHTLLALALEKAAQRVVVKRPRHGVRLSDIDPHITFCGKSTRFDVYLTY